MSEQSGGYRIRAAVNLAIVWHDMVYALGTMRKRSAWPWAPAPGRLRNMIAVQGMRLALTGIAIGVGAVFGLTRLIAGFLFGVKTWDPVIFLTVPLVLIAATLFAVWLPAVRATRIDPVNALRSE